MTLSEQQKLIFDTLHYRPPIKGNSFVVNEPGLKLIAGDASFIPPIKSALMEVVPNKNRQQLYGLGYLIGAFLVIGSKYAPEMLVPFIESVPQEFAKDILSAIPVFFQKSESNGVYIFSVAPAAELFAFVKQLSNSERHVLQKVAQRVIVRMQ